MPTVRPRFSAVLLAVLVAVVLLAGCSGSSGKPSAGAGPSGDDSGTTEATTAVDDEPTSTLPPGAVAGLEDFDGDGQPDPTCGTQDFGAGLVLRIPCTIISANEPEAGTRLVAKSLFRLPGSTDVDLTGISGSLVLARDAAGARVVIVLFNTDNLFQTGSATIGSTDTLDATIRLINARYPRSAIQVRGHTDATGTVAANQTLSERRASTVKDYLTSHGVQASEVTSVGLGSSQPLTEEHNADGSDSPAGRRFNRRVEIVLRPR
jgi:outer membrane protein OmpA-like peptidoglycan-associated protein